MVQEIGSCFSGKGLITITPGYEACRNRPQTANACL